MAMYPMNMLPYPEQTVIEPRKHRRQTTSETKMKRLPSSEKELLKEARSLHLLGPSPNLEKPRAKLLNYVYNSWKIRRSFNHTSILLIGSTGNGKSSTVNHLFNTKENIDLVDTSETESETKVTQEYIIHANDQEYEVSDLPLGVVDTPGFNDTGGFTQDACNFFSIKKFFKTHPNMSGCYPNLVFLLVRATDNRIKGTNSSLSKSLRCIKNLNVIDRQNPNVVVIITFCCSCFFKSAVAWSKRMETFKEHIQEVMFNALHLNAPVVLLENDYGEDGCDLEVHGDYTSLPNGELQPRNLYEACASVLQRNNDHLGLITLNSVFKLRSVDRPTLGHKFKAKNATESQLNCEEEILLQFFVNAARGGMEDPILAAAQIFSQKEKLQPQEHKEVIDLAFTLKRMGFQNKEDCKSATVGSVEFFHDSKISSTGEQMLRQQFQIAKRSTSNGSKSIGLVGQGYNILTDTPVATHIMKFDFEQCEYGIDIPTCAKFEKVWHTRSIMDEYVDDESYVQSRLANLSISLDVDYKIFNMRTRAGRNKSSSSFSGNELSFLFEHQMFKLTIGNYKDNLHKGMTFTDDFKSAVTNLPTAYDKSDDQCRSHFEKFFNRFGHFMISSAHGGGSIETKVTRETYGIEVTSFAGLKAYLSAPFDRFIFDDQLEASGNNDSSTATKSRMLLSHSTHEWKGGDTSLHDQKTITDKEERLKWRASLLVKPAMLETEMTLEPISTVVACVDAEKDQSTYEALKDLLGGECRVLANKKTEKPIDLTRAEATTREETVQKPNDSDSKCFPSNSVVSIRSKDGIIRPQAMADLAVGDRVLSWDEKKRQAIFSKVIMFAHRDSNAVNVTYLKIALDDGSSITLSKNHLIMVGDHKKAIMAKNVKNDDILFAIDEKLQLSPRKILAVDKVALAGIYCPITTHGNLVVNNVLASCYASVQDHVFFRGLLKASAQNISHLGLMPMRLLHKFCSKWVGKIPEGQVIHPYLQWLCKLNFSFLDNYKE